MTNFAHGSLLAISSVLAFGAMPTAAHAQETTAAATGGQAASSTAPVRDEFDILMRADTLVLTPVLSTALMTPSRTVVAGERAEFLSYSNYPAFITRGEIRIFRTGQSPDAEPVVTVPVNDIGHASWDVPTDGDRALYFVYRAYGAGGVFDETAPQELTVVQQPMARSDAPHEANESFGSVDQAARRAIPLSGIMATVSGRAHVVTDRVFVSGQVVPVDESGRFVAQQIVPRSDAGLTVEITRDGEVIRHVEQSFAAPRESWLLVGQGDLTVGLADGNGPAVLVSGDPTADGSYAMGRAAFYARGRIGEDLRISASLDTGESLLSDLFSNLDRKDPRQLLRRLDQNQYYPTYGDDSTLVEDAPTQGRFYVRVEKGASQFVVGNFTTTTNGTDLVQLDRGLFGALIDARSAQTTDFGERRYQLTAFASDPGTVPAREEFRGTGGSLYFLQRQDVSVGSERVRIEVRDPTSGIVLESRDLYAEQDYEFDPFQGRLILLRPLASTVAASGVVRDGNSSGNIPVLVVRYEYTPVVGSLDGYTVGGRGSAWVSDQLRLGVTAQRDTVEEAHQTLLGADALYRVAAGTYFKSEIAQTRGPGFDQYNSIDGGLSFVGITNPGGGKTARAWRSEIAVNFAELAGRTGDQGNLSGYYEHYDQGFSSAGRLTTDDTERWGIAGAVPLGGHGRFVGKYDEISAASLGSSRTGTVDLVQQWGMWNAKAGLRYDDRVPGLSQNSVQDGHRLDLAVQLGVRPVQADYNVYVFGQATLDRSDGRSRNNRVGIGAGYDLTDRLSMSAEASAGDGGVGADVQFNRRMGNGSEAYLGFLLSPDRTDLGTDPQNIFTRSDRGTLTVGARHRFSDAFTVNGETRTSVGGPSPSLTRSFGLRYAPTAQLTFTGSLENGRIDDPSTGLFRRFATTVGAGYADDGVRIGSSVEMRTEDGANVEQTVWLFRNDFSYEVNRDWRAIGRLNLAFADTDSPSVRAAEYTEAVAGLAYRPVDNERLNALFRVMYYEDLGPVGQVTGSGETQSPKQSSTIVSLDVSYDLSRHLTIGGKYGYRAGRVSLARDSDEYVSSEAHLGVVRLDYHVHREWDLLAEGRLLRVTASDDNRWGALAAVYRHVGPNLKVGVGYSWSDYSDDLTDQSYSSHGPFLNLVAAL